MLNYRDTRVTQMKIYEYLNRSLNRELQIQRLEIDRVNRVTDFVRLPNDFIVTMLL